MGASPLRHLSQRARRVGDDLCVAPFVWLARSYMKERFLFFIFTFNTSPIAIKLVTMEEPP